MTSLIFKIFEPSKLSGRPPEKFAWLSPRLVLSAPVKLTTLPAVAASLAGGLLAVTCLLAGWPAAADPAGSGAVDTNADTIARSVVKIFATVRYPDLYKPWAKGEPSDITGSGAVIDGQRILTCAHVALYASDIQVQANQAGDKVSAHVEFIAPGIDLAILKLDDDSFFTNHPALPLSRQLPATKDAVMVYGFPEGGTSLSITKGIVSRTEFAYYNFPVRGLRVQIDAAINPGNSGGPAIVGDKLIGLAFSHLTSAENIGYIIPAEEISLFLDDIADGHYDGKPAMDEGLQTLENPALRSSLKAGSDVSGMVVTHPASDDSGYPLKKWDIITHIGNTPVDDQGMIKLNDNLLVDFEYLVQVLTKDGKVPLTIVRNGRSRTLQLPVSANRPYVLPPLNNTYPEYFICGPLVFSVATSEFFQGLAQGERGNEHLRLLAVEQNPLIRRFGSRPAFPGEQLVVIPSPFFPHRLVKGYGSDFTQVVRSINGITVKNLAHLVQILRDSRDPYITIEFASNYSETLVFPRAELLAATDDILTDNGIRSQGSPDLMKIWNGADAK